MIGDYKKFLKKFKEKGYEFISFDDLDLNSSSQLILRHDIDFDIKSAYEIAKIEYKENISSTYFFLLRNESYNFFSKTNISLVKEIIKLGHKVSIHFDANLYSDSFKGIKKEIDLFNTFFNTQIKIVSLHRPSKKILSDIENFKHTKTTYDEKFFSKIKYFSDSTGKFRYGHPFDSIEFKNNQNIQLLIHPIWWIGQGNNNNKIVDWLRTLKIKNIDQYLNDNLSFYENK